ncbi:uncharacterized protein LOC112693952 [Sipha flava]|uniref:Uncharacterized protein LOC112693952 n=1 Tax=Sipha flava TaxID=143950 RepID=A0A8B8GRY8_9HEMI|nr:uncharacterized protein LOC112693952 [Sipha flava]
MTEDFGFKVPKNITKLSLSNFDVNQNTLNILSEYLQTEESVISELVFDGINLSNMNYLCCITPNSKVNKLWLSRCQLKDKGIEDLITVLDETNIKTQLNSLYLDRNGITCKGARQIAQILRTNRTLQSLSLASNLIKDEGILAIMNVLSKFDLDDYETEWKFKYEQRRKRLVEYLVCLNNYNSKNDGNVDKIMLVVNMYCIVLCTNMDTISCIELEKEQRSVTINPTINSSIILTDEDNLKQKAEKLLISPTHPYLTDQLLRSGSSFHCLGNFKIEYLNISYNRCSSNVLSFIEQVLQYQQNICLPEEGIKDLKIEKFIER